VECTPMVPILIIVLTGKALLTKDYRFTEQNNLSIYDYIAVQRL
jgi:hypothetical protein